MFFLDEPTNHLDLPTLQWLETFLTKFQGAQLIVSHDRYFLDRICTHILEIHAGHGIDYETAKVLNKIIEIKELNIGHFLIGESIFNGFNHTIKRFKK